MPELMCPLCHDSAKMKRPRTLYGHAVCRRCWSSFMSKRQVAWIVDILLIQVVVGFFIGFTAGVLGLRSQDVSGWVVFGAVCVAVFFKDGFRGHSLGKLICGVQVVDAESGTPAGFGRSFLRNWALAVPLMPLVVAVTMSKGPRIGDGMAKTRVLWKRYRGNAVFSSTATMARVFE